MLCYFPVVDGAWWAYNIFTMAAVLQTITARTEQSFTIIIKGDKTIRPASRVMRLARLPLPQLTTSRGRADVIMAACYKADLCALLETPALVLW